MRIDLPCCRHSEMKGFCKYHSDGNCKLNISECKAPCEKYIDGVVEQLKNMYIPIVEDLGDTSYELVRKREAIDIVKAGGVNE